MTEIILPPAHTWEATWVRAVSNFVEHGRPPLRSWMYVMLNGHIAGTHSQRPSSWLDVEPHEDVEAVWSLQPNLNFGRLAKLMSRTTSMEDPESLASIRKANELVAEAGVTWGELCLRMLGAAVQEEKKAPAESLSAETILETTLRFLLTEGKINAVMHESLSRMVRMAFRSPDEGFHRRVSRKIGDILRGAGSAPVGSEAAP